MSIPDINSLLSSVDSQCIGNEMHRLMSELYPICRSITGNGVRETLKRLKEHIPIETHEVPSGTRVFDWSVPKEWNIRDAYIKNSKGEKVVDFKNSNLHILNYSIPVHKKVSLSQLKEHLFTMPEYPAWVPYRTSYYKEDWGFCIPHSQYENLQEGEYEVMIDSSLEDGHLTYGELYIEGDVPDEILISTHICHPSMCNDNLSGLALCCFLARHLSTVSKRYSYRFLFIPGTIGSITWLAIHEHEIEKIKHGLVVACVGDPGRFTYKKSRRGSAEIDKAVIHTLQNSGIEFSVQDFSPYGYDERQYCSPGLDLPVGCLMRTPHGQFPEYHTSADDLNFVRPEALGESFYIFLSVLNILDRNKKYLNLNPKGEPQLGRRGLYDAVPGNVNGRLRQFAMLWALNLSDGTNDLLEISHRSDIDFRLISDVADLLEANHLLKVCS